ncbi:MAG: radical SAM family heme chaperone HemW [Candidatus Methylacidiphilales bacterium]|nr:radical SAM family heme chaperone HemW [Candidatus Methylacidiphilales bacterium]
MPSHFRSPISHLYVHIPFCTHICPYCAFHKERNLLPAMKAFLPALKLEIARARDIFDLQPETVFFGGGTPSALSISQLEDLFSIWPRTWTDVPEFTFEANPMTFSPDKARRLRDWGVNRISLGVQSFDDGLLQLLGRTHRRDDIRRTMDLLRGAGFRNINVDLMFSLPGQTIGQWVDSLEQALALQPEHISTYNLTYEEDTAFLEKHRRGEFVSDESTDRSHFTCAMDVLETAGYGQYEISNFARPGFESRHNQAIWEGRDYLGLGPSAVSTVGGLRWKNIADTLRYAASVREGGPSEREEEILTEDLRQDERTMLALRTREGVPAAWLVRKAEETARLLEAGLLERSGDRFTLTRFGKLVADSVTELLV